VKNKEPIYVIGFPKSGNTWLARMLAEMTRSNIAVSTPMDVVNAADNSSERNGRYVIHKEHVVKDVDGVLQSKVIYIVRDVRDVLVSWFFHCNRWIRPESIIGNALCKRYLNHEVKKSINILRSSIEAEFIAEMRYRLRLLLRGKSDRMIIGGWSEHVHFWTCEPSVVVVKYEDLLKDTEGELRRIAISLGLAIDFGQIPRVVFNQSFKKKKIDFQNKGDDKNSRFLRSGKAGSWKDFLDISTVKKIECKHADIMNKFGYIRK